MGQSQLQVGRIAAHDLPGVLVTYPAGDDAGLSAAPFHPVEGAVFAVLGQPLELLLQFLVESFCVFGDGYVLSGILTVLPDCYAPGFSP